MSSEIWTTTRKQAIKEFQKLLDYGVPVTAVGTTQTTWKTYAVGVFSDTDLKDLLVYTIPIKELRFNYDNGRLTDQLEHYKNELKKKGEELSYAKSEHQDEIQKILITSQSYSNVSSGDLKESLKLVGQNNPAIISNTGIIWNGNRRIANRRLLEIDEGDAKYGFVEVVVLPEMNLKQLQDLETRLQRQEDFKQNYSAITECLNIRKRLLNTAYIKDWQNPTTDEKNYMKTAFPKVKGNWKGIIKEKELIDLIDDFLNDVVNKPLNYHWIQSSDNSGGLTYFQGILNTLIGLRESGTYTDVKIEAIKWALLATALKPKKAYGKIRSLNKCFQSNRTLTDEYLANDKVYEKIIANHGDISFIKTLTQDEIEKGYKNLEVVAGAYDSIADDPSKEFEKFYDFLLVLDKEKIKLSLEQDEFIETLNTIVEKINILIDK